MFEQSTMLILGARENPQLNCLLRTIVSQLCPNFILKSQSIVLSISQLSNIAYMSGPRCDRCCGQVRVFPHHGPAVEEEQEPQPRNIRLLPRGGPQQKLRLQVGSRGQEQDHDDHEAHLLTWVFQFSLKTDSHKVVEEEQVFRLWRYFSAYSK